MKTGSSLVAGYTSLFMVSTPMPDSVANRGIKSDSSYAICLFESLFEVGIDCF